MNPNKKPQKEATKSVNVVHEDNLSTLKFYRNIIIICNIFYFLCVILWFSSSLTLFKGFLSFSSLICMYLAYKFMFSMSRPTYSADMKLIDVGLDLNMSGSSAEHAKDVIIVTSLAQSLSILSHWFWLILLFIPFRVFHLVWIYILAPWIFDQNQSGREIDEKKKKKMEKRMIRQGR